MVTIALEDAPVRVRGSTFFKGRSEYDNGPQSTSTNACCPN